MDVPELVGHTYAEALQAFQESLVIGCLTAAGLVELNPPPAYVFGRVMRSSSSPRTTARSTFAGFADVPAPAPGDDGALGDGPVRVLIVGWSDFARKIVDGAGEPRAVGPALSSTGTEWG